MVQFNYLTSPSHLEYKTILGGLIAKKEKGLIFCQTGLMGRGWGVQRAICYEPVVAETSSVFENISERVHFKVFLIVVLMDPPMVSVVPKVNPEY